MPCPHRSRPCPRRESVFVPIHPDLSPEQNKCSPNPDAYTHQGHLSGHVDNAAGDITVLYIAHSQGNDNSDLDMNILGLGKLEKGRQNDINCHPIRRCQFKSFEQSK
jgi:hypothetical protein